MIVAVLDNGVDIEAYGSIGRLLYNLEVTDDLKIIEIKSTNKREGYKLQSKSENKYKMHGTICAAIIKNYCPEVHIISIKVINEINGRGNTEKVIKALKWCEEKRIPVCHMSIGSQVVSDYIRMSDVLSRLMNSGTIVIAAMSNDGMFSVPSDFPGVIRVRADGRLKNNEYRIGKKNCFDADFYAPNHHFLTLEEGRQEWVAGKNSFAAPVITALICRIMNTYHKYLLSDIIEELYKGAINNSEDIRNSLYMNRFPDFKYSIMKTIEENKFEKLGLKDSQINKFYFNHKEYIDSILKLEHRNINLDVPVIEIKGDSEQVLELKIKFMEYLIAEKYEYIFLSNMDMAPFDGMIWIPKEIDILESAPSIINKFNVDIAFLCVEEQYTIRDQTFVDIIVEVSKSSICCTYDKYYKCFGNDRDIYESIVLYIMKLLI